MARLTCWMLCAVFLAGQTLGHYRLPVPGPVLDADKIAKLSFEALMRERDDPGAETVTRMLAFSEALASREQFENAETLLNAAADLAREQKDPRGIADALRARGVFLARRERLDEAEAAFEEASAIRERELRAAMIALGLNMVLRANVALDRGDHETGEQRLWRALEIYRTALGPDHKTVGIVAGRLAQLCRDTGREDRARRIEEQFGLEPGVERPQEIKPRE